MTRKAASNTIAVSGAPSRPSLRTPTRASAALTRPARARSVTTSVVQSSGSGPASARSAAALSTAVRVSGPILSMLQESGIAPARLTSPAVGRIVVIPQYAAGMTSDPPVSDPSERGISPAATALADPDEDPPLHLVGSHGFRPGPSMEAFA